MKRTEKIYTVDWYTSGGFCYRTTTECTWENVREMKLIAKALGETIKYEYAYTRVNF